MATQITVQEYFAAEGTRFSNSDARKIGPVLYELSRQGGVTRRDVLDAARSENSPLRSYFEWDDKVAADMHRLHQAGQMLQAIRVRYVDESGEKSEAKAFQVVSKRAWEPEQSRYQTFQVLHGDSAFAAQMLGNAFEELGTWKRRYEPYTGMWKAFGECLQQVVNQIEEWAETYRVAQPTIETDEVLAKLLMWRDDSREVLETWTNCRENIEFILEAIEDAEMTFKKIDQTTTRECMKCGREFKSLHAGHRLCQKCLDSKTVNRTTPNAAMTWEG